MIKGYEKTYASIKKRLVRGKFRIKIKIAFIVKFKKFLNEVILTFFDKKKGLQKFVLRNIKTTTQCTKY